MTLSNDQWQEAIVQLANSGLSAAAMSATGSAVPGSADYIGANNGGNLVGLQSDGTNLLTKDSNSAAMKSDLDSIVTNTAGLATQATLAAIKADLDTLVTDNADVLADGDNLATINTNTAPFIVSGAGGYIRQDSTATIAKESGGNLATLAGIVSSSKAAVKASSGDFPAGSITDLATIAAAIASTRMQIGRLTTALYSLASTTTSGTTQNSGDLTVGPYTEIGIDINTTAQAGTSPTIQYFYERRGADGIYYVLWQSNVLTAAANTLSTSIGAGMAYNQSLGSTGRLRWVIGGSATPTFTHSLNIYAK